ncbi:phosphoribosyltransferase [Candidatus Desulforudis audaxviator]|uniref:Phosphoribosyltransferase n=1 Tax=Desulforudis audaxviator (strain MP104C) TaxID=477974 RepID=B1I6R3_DESAP|nr:phosphoribosyltransferase family protein [Candidatus Desulforudis audaxviator]ACA60711.1 phosphoribosyltransferase [Candidatus Desulforudis audaxviator MP104C]AZK60797.1 Phosphoribosyl transferase domain protein [Candidatus Desulforudis audaxviator]
MFRDRVDAGRRLAARLAEEDLSGGLVLGIPRGGVVVAAAVAAELALPLDIIVPRKIGAPRNPELAVGAVTQDGTVIYNDRLLQRLMLRADDLEGQVQQEIKEIERRMTLYRGSRVPPELAGRTVILIDDGIATGYTVLAALRSLRRAGPRRIILAVPVAPPETLERLKPEVDRIVCLEAPDDFYAVGQFYLHFDQNSDQEVIDLLQAGRNA